MMGGWGGRTVAWVEEVRKFEGRWVTCGRWWMQRGPTGGEVSRGRAGRVTGVGRAGRRGDGERKSVVPFWHRPLFLASFHWTAVRCEGMGVGMCSLVSVIPVWPWYCGGRVIGSDPGCSFCCKWAFEYVNVVGRARGIHRGAWVGWLWPWFSWACVVACGNGGCGWCVA